MANTIHSISWVVAAGFAGMLLAAAAVQAQLLSPGQLSASHADLEGVTKCTSCHTIGGKGVDQAKCLDCHDAIRTRIEAGTGYHGKLSDPCVACHKDHLGREFRLVRLDTASFDHSETGYELLGKHAETQCASCHRPEYVAANDVRDAVEAGAALRRTYLGLTTACSSCHASDDPHANQFLERQCSDCHVPEKWTPAPGFKHDEASFPLTGLHVDVACRKCHAATTMSGRQPVTQFVGLAHAECSDCHRDPHASAFGPTCSSCHSTSGWSKLISERAFGHEQTGYRLLGAHRRLACASCHRRPARSDAAVRITFVGERATKAFPKIEAATCLSCHVDHHAGAFAGGEPGASCDGCHTNDGWIPTTFGIDRHNASSRFALSGAHLSVPCGSCHLADPAKPVFHFENLQCVACHAKDNPHGSQFDSRMAENSCASCHTTSAWNSEVNFDHTSTGFPLVGAHAYLKCTRCHVPEGEISTSYGLNYTGLQSACVSCHAADDPHQGQFEGRDCAECHEATTFRPVSRKFDHAKAKFALDGAHRKIPCAACHVSVAGPTGVPFTRYLLEKTQCVDCHLSE